MSKLKSRFEQVVEALRQGMLEGRWRGELPGRERLATQIGCSHATAEKAIQQLEGEGWLVSQGRGRRRRIEVPTKKNIAIRRVKRVRILLYENPSSGSVEEITLLARLLEAGYAADFSEKSLTDLQMDVGRVARFVQKKKCDAWIVCSGSREILTWFSNQQVPAMALFGRFTGLPIAATGPKVIPAMQKAVRRLVELGHERIVMITNPERTIPYPALFEQAFLDELLQAGLPAGPYNMPAVEAKFGALQVCLKELFRWTPPSAILLCDAEHVLGTYQFVSEQGLKIPENVSLVSPARASGFAWCDPPVSHYQWRAEPVIQYVLRWLDSVVQGKKNTRQRLFDAEFFDGGTIAPPKL